MPFDRPPPGQTDRPAGMRHPEMARRTGRIHRSPLSEGSERMTADEMYKAVISNDANYDGLFFMACCLPGFFAGLPVHRKSR